MAIRSDKTIYQILEKRLREASDPLTCVNLMEFEDVRCEFVREYGGNERDVQRTIDKLSDALGVMWWRGLVTRFPAPRSERSLAKYSYIWYKKIEPPCGT